MKNVAAIFALALAVWSGAATAADGDSLVRLLNSRCAMSPKAYVEAVGAVRADADRGGTAQRFVIALIAGESNAPVAARIGDSKRAEWLDESRPRLRRLAEQKDNPLAWYLLSLENNDTVMLERAAEGGNVQALNAWGNLLMLNAGSMPSTNSAIAEATMQKGFDCFRRAAGKKDANGLYNLGMCYLQGLGCGVDCEKAFQCFRSASEAGHPEAINNIGGCYRDGLVVASNAVVSAKWFKKSADLGNPYGELNYALALQRGDGVKKDEKLAVKYLQSAVDQGNVEAMAAMGMCYWRGCGVEKNLEMAFRNFRRSAEGGFPPAMDNLSTCYGQGLGTPRDILKSALWKMRFRGAKGDPEAIAWLKVNDNENTSRR